MVFGGSTSKRRVLPLQVNTTPVVDVVVATTTPSAAQRSLIPPKSPLHTSRTRVGGSGTANDSMGGFDRILLLRNMNVSVAISGLDVVSTAPMKKAPNPSTVGMVEEVSAAQNLKERKQMEARRRAEVQLMTMEDYVNTPEGEARLRRQDERARMQEEDLRMQRVVQHERALRRAEQLRQRQEEEAKLKEMYLAKRKAEREEQERVAREKEAARQKALEAKMKALKEEADRKAREEYAARQRALAEEARAEQDLRVAAMETAMMQVEDVLGGAMRAMWLAEVERLKQIEAEAKEWAMFEEQEAQRQREETQRRREAQKEQYEQDRARRMQIHKLHQERERAMAERKRNSESKSDMSVASTVPTLGLQLLRSQTDAVVQPPVYVASVDQADGDAQPKLSRQSTARVTTPAELSMMTMRLQRPSTALTPVCESPVTTSSTSPRPASVIVEEHLNTPVQGCSPSLPPSDLAENNPSEDRAEPVDATFNGRTEHPAKTETSTQDHAPVDVDQVPPQTVLSLDSLCRDGITPIAEVLSVNVGSPAMAAGLVPHDLLLELDGITSATPKCLVSIAQCIQNHVDLPVSLVVLRRCAHDSDQVERRELCLIPHKWKGKGLLGCQLSPFKWPDAAAVTPAQASESTANDEADNPGAASSIGQVLVVYQVQADSLAQRVGLGEGDVLSKCGDLDPQAHDLTTVAEYLQRHWREAQREVTLVLQRWDAVTQDYSIINAVLPVPSVDQPLGCALTTYSQYYYPAACEECCYSCLASSLHAAALSGHVQCLESLIAWCSSVDVLDWRDDEGRSPLFYACYAMQVESVRCLLAHLLPTAFDPVAGVDSYGDSPLHAAASSGCVAAVELLLASRFIDDVNLPNPTTQATAAHVAVSQSLLQVLKEEFNADLLALDADGRMPLFYACLRCDVASVAYLCELHRDFVDYADSAGGSTPLHMAAWCGYRDIVETLLKWLPTIALFVPNQDGLDARALAAHGGWTEIVDMLDARMRQCDATE